jgi:4-amino-4-deoxy-L-arabinose transferase-like glycosyltransferase
MLYVSLIVEALRARPALMFWTAALAQALLWTLVPTLFYPAPPGDVPLMLAIGHEWRISSAFGPPLAYWLAEAVFDVAGHRASAIYLLSQICVVVSFWAVFALGRSIVGARHAVMAVLLMAGITAFSMPTPEFGPTVLAMPLTALAFLYYWRAVGQSRRGYWLALGLDLGLLGLTAYAGLIVVALIAVFTVATRRGRALLSRIEPWAAGLIVIAILLPYAIWAVHAGEIARPTIWELLSALADKGHLIAWLGLIAWLLFAHAGLIALAGVASGLRVGPRTPAPAFERTPLTPFAKEFVYYFALAPAVTGTLLAVMAERAAPIGGGGALVVLSALAIIVAAGDVIRLHRQRSIGVVWLLLLVLPPGIVVATAAALPWTLAIELETNQPSTGMAEFFTDSFRRRTGRPLAIVVGDARIAGLVALASADRPSLSLDPEPELTPWVSEAAIRDHGAVLLWQASDPGGMPPASIKARFPDLVPEVPRSFEHSVQGRLGLTRIGWAVIRPQAEARAQP